MSITKTETAILESAEAVFLRKGLEASTMQDIATEAGISRTLLHYYHRNKDTLYKAILVNTVNEFIPMVSRVLELDDVSLLEKAEKIIDCYIEFLLENPLIPQFITMEVRRDPEYLIKLIREKSEKSGHLDHVKAQIAKELHITENTDLALAHMFTTMYGLIMFPFLVRPVLDEVFFDNNAEGFREFMLQKKHLVLVMISALWQSLKVEDENENDVAEEGAVRKPKKVRLPITVPKAVVTFSMAMAEKESPSEDLEEELPPVLATETDVPVHEEEVPAPAPEKPDSSPPEFVQTNLFNL